MYVPRKIKTEFKPIKIDKNGPAYDEEDVADVCLGLQEKGTYLTKRANKIQTDYDKAQEALDTGRKAYTTALNKFLEEETKLEEATKKAVSKIKNTTGKLGQSILRLEQQADFDRLNQYVSLLERAEIAMNNLAQLEKRGVLKKISDALK